MTEDWAIKIWMDNRGWCVQHNPDGPIYVFTHLGAALAEVKAGLKAIEKSQDGSY